MSAPDQCRQLFLQDSFGCVGNDWMKVKVQEGFAGRARVIVFHSLFERASFWLKTERQ